MCGVDGPLTLELLPLDVLVHCVLSFLSPADLSKTSQTCRLLSRIAMDESLFERLARQRGAAPPAGASPPACWRQELLNRKRSREYAKMMTMGALGRLPPPRILAPLRYTDGDWLAALAGAGVAHAPPRPSPEDRARKEDADRRGRMFRQGTAAWKCLENNNRGGEEGATGASGGAGAEAPPSPATAPPLLPPASVVSAAAAASAAALALSEVAGVGIAALVIGTD